MSAGFWVLLEEQRRTVGDSLGVKVGLGGLQIGTNEFEVDFVLDIGEQDEGSHNTFARTGGEFGRDLAVPHIMVAGKERAD